MVNTCEADGESVAEFLCACQYPLVPLCPEHAEKHRHMAGFHFLLPLEAVKVRVSEEQYQAWKLWLFRLNTNIEIIQKKTELFGRYMEDVDAAFLEAQQTLQDNKDRIKDDIQKARQAFTAALDTAIAEVRENALNSEWESMSNSVSQLLWYYDSSQLETYPVFSFRAYAPQQAHALEAALTFSLWGFENYHFGAVQDAQSTSGVDGSPRSNVVLVQEEQLKESEDIVDSLRIQLAETTAEVAALQQLISAKDAELKKLMEVVPGPAEIQGQVPDYRVPKAEAALKRFGSYPAVYDEERLVLRGPVDQDGVYEGQWNARGQKHGFGVLRKRNGDVYEGHWRDGKKSGRGRLIWGESGDVYEGEFSDNRMEGFGKLWRSDGTVVTGLWSSDRQRGVGMVEFTSHSLESCFVGEFEDGARKGRGACFYRDGAMHIGTWLAGRKSGKGLNSWEDETIYLGEFIDGNTHGRGCFVWSNGTIYCGNTRAGKRHGRGKMIHPGEYYDGLWSENMKHGEGVCKVQDGSLHCCLYENDTHVKWLS